VFYKNEEENEMIMELADWIVKNENGVEFFLWSLLAIIVAKALFFEIVRKDREGVQ
jgi:hypothetical protein